MNLSPLLPNLVFLLHFLRGGGSEHEERLIIDLFRGYNSLIRPVPKANSSSLTVAFSLAMILLINVDEKNQVMQTNVWLTMVGPRRSGGVRGASLQRWTDYQMRWNPDMYGKIQTIRVPPDKVWLPDVVLFNNADGHYEVSFYSNVVIEHNGQMLWVPPAIYKSSCTIDVEYFPFDGFASEEEEKLMIEVFKGYNHLIQPVKTLNDTPITVRLSLQLILLINVDEKDQIMQTNVWLTLKWHDFQMKWNPVNYGEIKQIRVIPDKVWLPDVVLFNNADGQYEVSYYSNVVIYNYGLMLWVPPAIYKSSCIIDVEYFPFDEQSCYLIFGSWTYNEDEIKLDFDSGLEMVDLSVYSASSIWDVVDAPATRVRQRSRIEYQLRIRRKTLFYTVVLIIPTVLMAFLSMAVFFLPADSGEKITLTISLLLSIVVFLLLVSRILPPTSKHIPLMAKYLLLTFVLNVITILVTVMIINIYFRGPTTHRMPAWVRRIFLDFLPKVLCMKRPKQTVRMLPGVNGVLPADGAVAAPNLHAATHHPYCPESGLPLIELSRAVEPARDSTADNCYPLTPDAYRAIEAIEYITEHLRQDEEYKMIRDDWKYVAMMFDRLCLYIYFGVTLGGTLGILLSAPNVFEFVDQDEVIEQLKARYTGS